MSGINYKCAYVGAQNENMNQGFRFNYPKHYPNWMILVPFYSSRRVIKKSLYNFFKSKTAKKLKIHGRKWTLIFGLKMQSWSSNHSATMELGLPCDRVGLLKRKLPQNFRVVNGMVNSKAILEKIASDLSVTWGQILILLLASAVASLIWTFIMRLLGGFMIWLSILLLLGL